MSCLRCNCQYCKKKRNKKLKKEELSKEQLQKNARLSYALGALWKKVGKDFEKMAIK